MLQDIKKKLVDNPDKLIELLKIYGYANFKRSNTYLQFGRDSRSDSRKDAIAIRLSNNDNCYVKDFSKSISGDIFSVIMQHKGVSLADVISKTKDILGIDGSYEVQSSKKCLFGGFYDKVKKKTGRINEGLDVNVLEAYELIANKRFLRDRISILSQIKFGVRYDKCSQSIIIPIFDWTGTLIGIKNRRNCNADETTMKYYYSQSCNMSSTLFGYSQNYQYLFGADVVLIFEAEKSVLQADTYGFNNCVALGSSSLSSEQAKLLLGLCAKKYIFLMDIGLEPEVLEKNIKMLKTFGRMFEFEVMKWNSELSLLDDKSSPTDHGKEVFEEILELELEEV